MSKANNPGREGAPFRYTNLPLFSVRLGLFTGPPLISHAGVRVLTGFMDALGFGRLCEDGLGQFVPSRARPRPGRLLGSLAAMLAAGGEHASDLDVLRSSPGIFGQLSSNATVSRFFERTVDNPELFSYGFETLTRELRNRVWNAAGNRNPALSATVHLCTKGNFARLNVE